MILTDEQIADIHKRATNQFLDPVNLCRAKAFIAELFAELQPAGFVDPDGVFLTEEWMGIDPQPLYRNPMA
jgi:hypothetical protein